MTSGSVAYLKRYVDRVQDVPAYLRRHLALIRDLDEKAQQLQQEIELNTPNPAASKDKKQKHLPSQQSYDLNSAVTKLVSLGDEKVTIAAQIYDFVDKHIQSLDEDLRNLDSEIRADKERLGIGEDDSAVDRLEAMKSQRGRGRTSAATAAAASADTCPEKKKRGRKRANPEPEEEEEGSRLLPLPAENEPLYCYCQKPSHGEMVACDHDECNLEWFHYECVGLTSAPVGEWYCPDCIKIMQNKNAR